MNDNEELQQIASLRREYTRGSLNYEDLPDRPMVLFEQWLHQACDAQLPDPTAMCLATVNQREQPYQRIVLLKYYTEHDMVFYTNLNSRKAQQLAIHPYVSLLFPWHFLERQIMVLGKVKKLSLLEVEKYFHSRPRDSQISAWVSKQSSSIPDRNILEEEFAKFKRKFSQEEEVPLPRFWGGFRIKIDAIEFWQGRANRLHDRFFYQRNGTYWKINRLAP